MHYIVLNIQGLGARKIAGFRIKEDVLTDEQVQKLSDIVEQAVEIAIEQQTHIDSILPGKEFKNGN